MFFLSNKNEMKSYTFINNIFFENIMPYIEDRYLKVYMYIYYLAYNIDRIGVKTNEDIAKNLNMDYADVISAFDYLDKCNLIRKHYVENSNLDNYSIEILPISSYNKSCDFDYEEEYILSKNEKLRDMYEKIEDIAKVHLNAYDIKKIDTVIKNNDVAYEVVVEAFKFVYYNKKSLSVNDALSTLKMWIKDGIYTSTDLDKNLSNINERYATYRKILKYFGEYRLPTKPEMKKIDKWLDEYNFSIEVIEKAIDETLKIKSPNFKYLDAILENWHTIYKNNKIKLQKNNEDYTKFRFNIISQLKISEKISENEEKKLSFLYKNYPMDTVKLAIAYMEKQKKSNTVDTLFDFVTGNADDYTIEKETVISFGNIGLEEMNSLLLKEQAQKSDKNTKNIDIKSNKSTKTVKNKSYVNTPTLTGKELEDAILSNNDLDEF